MFTFLNSLRSALTKSRTFFTESLAQLFLGKKVIDADLLENLEEQLVQADMGPVVTQKIITELNQGIARKNLNNPEAVYLALQQLLTKILSDCEKPQITIESTPTVILMVGINGAGKTTTIGKLAKHFQTQGRSVMLAAGDTFRAAAIEQLCAWGERNQVPVISQHTGADSASVIFDAFTAAKARGIEVLLADTAGRLHTRDNLMEELKKIIRVLKKIDPQAPHEILLVLDASTGQNGLIQAQKFHAEANITGLCLTKLDGTAKGGIIFAIAQTLGLPIRYIGVGEKIDDLQAFHAQEFVEALLK